MSRPDGHTSDGLTSDGAAQDGAALVERVRQICRSLVGTIEKVSHGAPSFFAGKQYPAVRPNGHHSRIEPHLLCAAPPGVQAELIEDDPQRFFRPTYYGGRGWIGVLLTGEVDWGEIAAILGEAHASVT